MVVSVRVHSGHGSGERSPIATMNERRIDGHAGSDVR